MPPHPSEARTQSTYEGTDPTEGSEYVLNPTEVARILDRSPHHVTALARTGKLRAKRMGSHWRFSSRDVMAYLERWAANDRSS